MDIEEPIQVDVNAMETDAEIQNDTVLFMHHVQHTSYNTEQGDTKVAAADAQPSRDLPCLSRNSTGLDSLDQQTVASMVPKSNQELQTVSNGGSFSHRYRGHRRRFTEHEGVFNALSPGDGFGFSGDKSRKYKISRGDESYDGETDTLRSVESFEMKEEEQESARPLGHCRRSRNDLAFQLNNARDEIRQLRRTISKLQGEDVDSMEIGGKGESDGETSDQVSPREAAEEGGDSETTNNNEDSTTGTSQRVKTGHSLFSGISMTSYETRIEGPRHQLSKTKVKKSKWFRYKHILKRPRLSVYWKQDKHNNWVLVEEDEERVAWSELFFDLIFVVGIALLADRPEYDLNRTTLGDFAMLFLAVYSVWESATFYINKYNVDDLVTKCYLLCEMGLVLCFTITAEESMPNQPSLYFVGARLLTAMMHVWASVFEHKARDFAKSNMILEIVTVLPTLATVTFGDSGPEKRYFFAVTVILGFFGPFFRLVVPSLRMPVKLEHLVEVG